MELYTKRAFRCDCGGPRLEGRCRLAQGKEANTANLYNQNFSGVYCECARPYPDPEDPDSEDCMIQVTPFHWDSPTGTNTRNHTLKMSHGNEPLKLCTRNE